MRNSFSLSFWLKKKIYSARTSALTSQIQWLQWQVFHLRFVHSFIEWMRRELDLYRFRIFARIDQITQYFFLRRWTRREICIFFLSILILIYVWHTGRTLSKGFFNETYLDRFIILILIYDLPQNNFSVSNREINYSLRMF